MSFDQESADPKDISMSTALEKLALPFGLGVVVSCALFSFYNAFLNHQDPVLYRKKGGRRSGIRTPEFSRKDLSDDARLLILLHHFMDVVERDVLPLVASCVCSSANNCISGGAILSKGNYEVVVAAVNQEQTSPLYHACIATLLEYSRINERRRPKLQETTILLTHEPCKYCVASLVTANVSTGYYLFRQGSLGNGIQGCSTEDKERKCSLCAGSLYRSSDLNLLCVEDIVKDLMLRRKHSETAQVTSAQEIATAAQTDRLLLLCAQRLSAFAKVFRRLDEERLNTADGTTK
jgi:tRNA(Arg) A34 adenosine deaminase TadA